jgi:peptide/nickel transport system ATP-binding protein
MNLLEVEGLSVDIPLGRAGVLHAVRDVSFSVAKGEVLGVVGESGCGKTLTALAMMDLLPRLARRRARALRFGGINLLRLSSDAMADLRGSRIAMIFQDPMTSLNPVLSIGEQLQEVYLRHGRGDRRAARARAVALLERVGIPAATDRLRQYPHQLSGGLRQRVMIAMALMCEPDLLIADEPTTALDVTIQAQVLALLKELQDELGLAVILVTHDLGVVSRVADRVLVMYAGEVVETAPKAGVFRMPCHPYTQRLLRCLPNLSAGMKGRRLASIEGTVPALTADIQECAFAERCPYAMAICREGGIALSDAGANHSYRCLLPREETLAHFRKAAE